MIKIIFDNWLGVVEIKFIIFFYGVIIVIYIIGTIFDILYTKGDLINKKNK